VIHRVAPQVQVVSGGLRGNDLGYLDALYDAFDTIGVHGTPFDLLGVEPFSNGAAPQLVDPGAVYEQQPFGTVDGNFLGFTGLHDIMTAHGDSDLGVYVTLFGYSTKAAGRRPAVPDETRARYLTAALDETVCYPYLRVFSWYAFHPNPWDAPQWTLLDRKGTPNHTYEALARWTRVAG
jgi:hypothetical protein